VAAKRLTKLWLFSCN